jgi:actin related protein 2/3 complex subunit 3
MPILPLKTKFKGPAPPAQDPSADDIIDEALNYFKANCMFRTFEVKGNADRLLIYVTLYIQHCVKHLTKNSYDKQSAGKEMYQVAIKQFQIPGDNGFPMGGMVGSPANRGEADEMRQYFTQIRQEVGGRLVERVYNSPDGKASKWWVCFSKRKFLNMELH